MARCALRHYRLNPDTLSRMETRLAAEWARHRPKGRFDACFSQRRLASAPRRKPAVMMAGFAFTPGGGEVFPIHLANLLQTRGVSVTFVDFARAPHQKGVRAMLAPDIAVIGIPPGQESTLLRHARALDIDIIHTHHGTIDALVHDLLTGKDDAPHQVITLHGFYETQSRAAQARLLPALSRDCTLTCVAKKNKDPFYALPFARPSIRHIPNALAPLPITPIRRADFGISENTLLAVQVSRALPEKGWDSAIAAVTRARAAGADVALILVGDGPCYDRLRQTALPPFVHLAGFRPNPRDFLAAADVALLPSHFSGESAPLVVIESLLAGTPVLASDLGETAAMLGQPAAGAVFALKDGRADVAALAGMLAHLAQTPAALDAMRAKVPAAAARFDPARMATDYEDTYDRALCRDTRPAPFAKAAR